MDISIKTEPDLDLDDTNSHLTSDSELSTHFELTGYELEFCDNPTEVPEYIIQHSSEDSNCSDATYSTQPVYTSSASIITPSNSPTASNSSMHYNASEHPNCFATDVFEITTFDTPAGVFVYNHNKGSENSKLSATSYIKRKAFIPATNIVASSNFPAASLQSSCYEHFAKPSTGGRPAKTWNESIDPKTLANLPLSERRRIQKRFLNTLASRKSRRKHREREEAEIAKEQALEQRNSYLKAEYIKVEVLRKKLQRKLKHRMKNA